MTIKNALTSAAIAALTVSLSACTSPVGSSPATVAASAETPAQPDPRKGLAPGIEDAGIATSNLSVVQEISMPEGFYDPNPFWAPRIEIALMEKIAAGERVRRQPNPIAFANTDLAFSGNRVVMGNFHGFNIYETGESGELEHQVAVVCPGGQGDVSIHGNLVFLSVEANRARLDCGSGGVEEDSSSERFLGVRIFDISDVKAPKQIAAVQTCKGSHTHTLVPDPNDPDTLYIYVSGTNPPRPESEMAGCTGGEPDKNPDTALYSIDVIKVPLDAPEKAKVINRPRIFADPETGKVNGLWKGGPVHVFGAQTTAPTNHCHDIQAFPAHGVAAGACSGNGILLDITDPANPTRIADLSNGNMAYWHAAVFDNSASKVVFTDEWGGGVQARCKSSDPDRWGANIVATISGEGLEGRGFFKIPGNQTSKENCVAHNGALIPVPGRDIMVQAWYSGGISVIDFTDPDNPYEIAFHDRGPINDKELYLAGYWAAYWHNGLIYGTDIIRGLDVFALQPSEHLSAAEIAAAGEVVFDEANSQTQELFEWPSSRAVASAWLDQIKRDGSLKVKLVRKAEEAIMKGEPDRELAGRISEAGWKLTGKPAERVAALSEVIKNLES